RLTWLLLAMVFEKGEPGSGLWQRSKLSKLPRPARRPTTRTRPPPGISSLDALPNPLRADLPDRRHYKKGKGKGAPLTIQLPKLVPRRRIAPDSALRLIPKLPGMAPQEIAKVFGNSVNSLADPAKAYLHDATRKLLDAISEEWRRREQSDGDPDGYFQ